MIICFVVRVGILRKFYRGVGRGDLKRKVVMINTTTTMMMMMVMQIIIGVINTGVVLLIMTVVVVVVVKEEEKATAKEIRVIVGERETAEEFTFTASVNPPIYRGIKHAGGRKVLPYR